MKLTSINPASGDIVATYEETTDDDVAVALDRAHLAGKCWRKREFSERAVLLNRAAVFFRANPMEPARLITIEMGKPIKQSLAEVEKCAQVLAYYAEHGASFLADEIPVAPPNPRDFVAYQPLGTILAVMPWNYPFWQVFRAVAPALMAGNVMVLKHASNVTGCALLAEKIIHEAGFPPGVFQTLVVGSRRVADLIAHPDIRGVTLTGSTEAGRKIGEASGRALKPCVLELGGSDPYLILRDADLDHAIPLCVQARLNNNGQSCIGAKRFIVEQPVLREFTERFVAAMAATPLGDPLDDTTTLGPLARENLRAELHRQVRVSVEAGASLLIGGKIPDRPGWYYPATVLGGVRPGILAYREELFGPVASIIEAADEADAIRIANDSPLGLGGGVFSEDRDRAVAVARQIETGAVFINDFVRSHPALPFGGVKDSGYGRELGAPGIRAFMNAQTISVS